MHIHIDTSDNNLSERAITLLQYSLNGYREDIDSMHLSIKPARDALGTQLSHCRLKTTLRRYPEIEIEEIQSSPDLAVTRVLERTMRTIQRRLESNSRRRKPV